MSIEPAHTLDNTVIGGGYCVGCGACAVPAGSPFRMQFRFGRFIANRIGTDIDPSIDRVCPFSDQAPNEDALAEELFSNENLAREKRLGYYRRLGAMFVKDDANRLESSSGGITTWLLQQLLDRHLVDGIIHVRPRIPTQPDSRLFGYEISTSAEEIQLGRSSHYYPVSMSQVLEQMRRRAGRYALVGIPCFIKAARLLARDYSDIHDRIAFTVGLVCGHLKTSGFAESLAAQVGVAPKDLSAINFRVKLPNQPSTRYGVRVVSSATQCRTNPIVRPNREFLGSDWGHSFFKLKSCDFCDDIFAETADVVIGDAWLTRYTPNWRGTSLVLTRNEVIDRILDDGIKQGSLVYDPLSPDEMVSSQRANFAHRRAALPHRLMMNDNAGRWRPRKRFERSSKGLSSSRARIIDLRGELAQITYDSWQEVRDIEPPAAAIARFKMQIMPTLSELHYLTQIAHGDGDTKVANLKRAVGDVIVSMMTSSLSRFRCLPHVSRSQRRRKRRAIVIPPASPGSLGDEAVVSTVVAELRKRGIQEIVIGTYSASDDWSRLGADMSTVRIDSYLGYRSPRDAVRLLWASRSAERAILCGTDVLDGHYNLNGSIGRLAVAQLLRNTGLPVTIVGASFSEDAPPAARHALALTNRSMKLCARDPISFSVIETFRRDGLTLVADPAFLLEPTVTPRVRDTVLPWIERQRRDGNVVMGLNVNHFLARADNHLIAAFRELILRLAVARPNLAICLIPHDIRGNPSDEQIARTLLTAVKPQLGDRCTVTPEGLTAGEVKEVAAHLDVLFSGKMHLCIAALGSGVPAGCITYKDKKFLGLFTHFGISQWLLPEDAWKTSERLFAFLLALIDQRDSLRERIAKELPRIRGLAERNFEEIDFSD